MTRCETAATELAWEADYAQTADLSSENATGALEPHSDILHRIHHISIPSVPSAMGNRTPPYSLSIRICSGPMTSHGFPIRVLLYS